MGEERNSVNHKQKQSGDNMIKSVRNRFILNNKIKKLKIE